MSVLKVLCLIYFCRITLFAVYDFPFSTSLCAKYKIAEIVNIWYIQRLLESIFWQYPAYLCLSIISVHWSIWSNTTSLKSIPFLLFYNRIIKLLCVTNLKRFDRVKSLSRRWSKTVVSSVVTIKCTLFYFELYYDLI